MTTEQAVKEYQCPGCVLSPFECFEKSIYSNGCGKHSPATYISSIGKVLLGLPRGFNRFGESSSLMVNIYKDINDFKQQYQDDGYNKLNVPVWKYLDDNCNTIVRVYLPRVSVASIHVFLCNELKNIDCIEITDHDLEGWD
jgi:hypothetical protein